MAMPWSRRTKKVQLERFLGSRCFPLLLIEAGGLQPATRCTCGRLASYVEYFCKPIVKEAS